MSFFEELKSVAQATEVRLEELTREYGRNDRLREAIRYSALNGGKRLRAYMAAEFCALAGGDKKAVADYGAALEMIHAFSLIHDDLPAMDNDDMRRGKPSNHKAFGESTAILAGDSLALDAFYVMGSNKYCSAEQNLKASVLLAEKSGACGMCAGQQIDLDSEGKDIDIEALTALVDCKTCALFECACMLGCIGANSSKVQLESARLFGLYTGRAFQIADDLLDIHSTPEELGKTIGKDIAAGKSTFPALLGEEGAYSYAAECIEKAKGALADFEDSESKSNLLEFCDFIINRKY